jgi:hypothetical protein
MHLEALRVIALMAHALRGLLEHAEHNGRRALEIAKLRRQDVAMADLVAPDRRQIDRQAAQRFPPSFADNAAEEAGCRKARVSWGS